MPFLRTLSLAAASIILSCASSAKASQRAVDISFKSGEVTLAGTLFLPDGPGPFPAVVELHGSEGGTRDEAYYNVDSSYLPQKGVAVFLYDKRGFGKSGGKLVDESFEPLIADALAAWRAVCARPEINPKKVGLKGTSQGGYLIAMAGARERRIAFGISISGPGVDANVQTAHWRNDPFRQKGVSADKLRQTYEARRVYWTYLATGKGYENADRVWKEFLAKGFAEEVGINPNSKVKTPKQRLRRDFAPQRAIYQQKHFDMIDIISKMKMPTLAVFGENDPMIPVLESERNWKIGFKKGHQKDGTTKIFKNAGHGIEIQENGIANYDMNSHTMAGKVIHLVPGYKEFITDWILARVVSSKSAKRGKR